MLLLCVIEDIKIIFIYKYEYDYIMLLSQIYKFEPCCSYRYDEVKKFKIIMYIHGKGSVCQDKDI
jgi:hypothetical protein